MLKHSISHAGGQRTCVENSSYLHLTNEERINNNLLYAHSHFFKKHDQNELPWQQSCAPLNCLGSSRLLIPPKVGETDRELVA